MSEPTKVHTLDIPAAGATVHIILPAGVDAAQIVVHAPEGVTVRIAGSAPPQTKEPSTRPVEEFDLDFIVTRLLKLRPGKRATALNAIKAMFQFDAPITDETAAALLDALRKRKVLSLDDLGRVTYRG